MAQVRRPGIVRGYPLGTAGDCYEWQASGTASEGDPPRSRAVGSGLERLLALQFSCGQGVELAEQLPLSTQIHLENRGDCQVAST
jgi:hypothetical protein